MNRFFPRLNIARPLGCWLLASAAYLVVVGLIDRSDLLPGWFAGDEAAAVLGFALGILLVFRTNTANDRWWEARRQWGQLVNDIRNLALKARAHVAVDEIELRPFGRLLIAFPHALRLHLRGVRGVAAVPGFEHDPTTFPHAPGYIAGLIHETLNRWNREGRLLDTMWVLDVHARSLLDVCGACERIRNTPLASSYRSLVRVSILVYVLVAPWSISLDTGWALFPVLLLAFAFMFGVELTAEAVEEPFGTEGDDLPLDHLCGVMQQFVEESLELPTVEYQVPGA